MTETLTTVVGSQSLGSDPSFTVTPMLCPATVTVMVSEASATPSATRPTSKRAMPSLPTFAVPVRDPPTTSAAVTPLMVYCSMLSHCTLVEATEKETFAPSLTLETLRVSV